MGKIRFLIYGLFGVLVLFGLNIGQSKAAEPVVVINELAWAGSSKSANDEWVELYNPTNDLIDLSGWQLTKKSSGVETLMLSLPSGSKIEAGGYFIIARYGLGDSRTVLNITPDFVSSAVTLSNSDLMITLYAETWVAGNPPLIVNRAWGGGAPTVGSNDEPKATMERTEDLANGISTSSWQVATASINFIDGATEKGTPGAKNSQVANLEPTLPKLLLPENQAELGTQTIDFSWQPAIDPEGKEIEYSLYLACSENIGDEDLVVSELTQTNYSHQLNLDCENYYWLVLASDGENIVSSEIFTFQINKPTYAENVIINELYPNPTTAPEDEWIELYNNSPTPADVSGWKIEDLVGSTDQYIIASDTEIAPYGFLVFWRTIIGITLNNDEDGLKLVRPDGITYQTPIFADGKKGWSYARDSAGNWLWTTTPTSSAANVFTADEKEDDTTNRGGDLDEAENTTPIEIKTGEISDHEDELVIITGKVTETSGDTFYLDDGSGKAKIYIQEKTGINKPPMHRGDVFQITGIVDLYGSTWRVLPQYQENIKLIEAAVRSTKASTTKKKASISSKITDVLENARAPAGLGIPAVKAASDATPEAKSKTTNTPIWIQIVKMLIGLLVILAILFFLRLRQIKKNKPLGEFGDDMT